MTVGLEILICTFLSSIISPGSSSSLWGCCSQLCIEGCGNNFIRCHEVDVDDVCMLLGTAMDALNSMQNFLRSRPKTFKSLENAIEWRYGLGSVTRITCLCSLTPEGNKVYIFWLFTGPLPAPWRGFNPVSQFPHQHFPSFSQLQWQREVHISWVWATLCSVWEQELWEWFGEILSCRGV